MVYRGLGLPKVMGPFFGGRVMRIIVYWGLFGGRPPEWKLAVGLMG